MYHSHFNAPSTQFDCEGDRRQFAKNQYAEWLKGEIGQLVNGCWLLAAGWIVDVCVHDKLEVCHQPTLFLKRLDVLNRNLVTLVTLRLTPTTLLLRVAPCCCYFLCYVDGKLEECQRGSGRVGHKAHAPFEVFGWVGWLVACRVTLLIESHCLSDGSFRCCHTSPHNNKVFVDCLA